MTDQAPRKDDFCCPVCEQRLEDRWVSCPNCGLRVKPGDDLFVRCVGWSLLLGGFAIATVLIAGDNPEAAVAFGVMFGLPLAYIFGKAVIFRLRGRPLTWKDLGWTSFRVALVGIFVTVVLPMIIGVALLILLFVVCGVMLLSNQPMGMHP